MKCTPVSYDYRLSPQADIESMRWAGAYFMKKALKRHGAREAIVTDGLRSYRAAITELGNERKQEIAAGRTTGARTATCPSDDGNGRCSGSGE